VINECRPKIFYSQIVEWDYRPDFKKINLLPGYPDNFCQLDTPAMHKSYCSPFVACQIAVKYHFANEVHLYGVDLVNHPHLDQNICQKIKTHFTNLNTAFRSRGINLIVHGNGILTELFRTVI